MKSGVGWFGVVSDHHSGRADPTSTTFKRGDCVHSITSSGAGGRQGSHDCSSSVWGRGPTAVSMHDGRAASSGPDNRGTSTSKNSAQDAQALLRASQEQQLQHSRMLPPSTYPGRTGGIISNTPFVPPFSTPSTGMRTSELHGPGYYHVSSPEDPGYAKQMRDMYGREDVDPP
jgi:hypothetical protein